MKKTTIILVLLFTVVATTVQVYSQITPAFYKLALTWPTSFCSETPNKCVKPIKPLKQINFFTVHGLWPHDQNGKSIPGYNPKSKPKCTTPAPPNFNGTKIIKLVKDATTLAKMDTYWPNLTDTSKNWSFWDHEWNKHGSCSPYAHNPEAYFEKGVELIQKHDILQYLHKQNIDPDATAKKTAQEFLDAIKNELGGGGQNVVEIKCNKNSTSNMLQLEEIRICFDSSAVNVIPCKLKFSGCVASDNILFPSI